MDNVQELAECARDMIEELSAKITLTNSDIYFPESHKFVLLRIMISKYNFFFNFQKDFISIRIYINKNIVDNTYVLYRDERIHITEKVSAKDFKQIIRLFFIAF